MSDGENMFKLRLILGIVAALAAGCAVKKGRSLVLVDLTSDVKSLSSARIVVVKDGTDNVGDTDATWDGSNPSPLKLGIYVPEDVSGPVDVYACGFAGNNGIAKVATPGSASVTAGASSAVVTLNLVAGAPASICAGGGAGGTGGTTPAGAGGNAGMAGASAGAGGNTGGASAGHGGGAVAGSGGAPSAGTGGGAAGAAGGRAGIGGGSAGSTAGKGGGSAGAGGMAGAGAAGKGGGAAGSGTPPHWYGQVAAGADATVAETVPAVAVDAAGNAVTVYEHADQIWFNYFSAATNTWGTPGPIDTRGSLAKPSVAVDKNGVWLAVWESNLSAAASKGIYQSTSTDGTHWSAPAPITNVAAYGPVLGMNADGTAIVAWTEVVGGTMYQAMASTRTATGASWAPSTVLRPGDDNGDRYPAVAVSGTGEAFVLWLQDDEADWGSIWSRQWSATTGWSTAVLFETFTEQRSDTPWLAANKSGVVIGTYVQLSGNAATMQLLARRYTPGTGFGPPLKVAEASDIDWSVAPTVTLDDAGNATAAWAARAPDKYQVYTSRQGPNDATWPASPMMMESDDAAAGDDTNNYYARTTTPLVRATPSGAVTLIWRKRTGTRFDLVGRHFEGGTWSAATLLETRNDYPVAWPALGVGAGGTAVAVWYYNTELDIWANVYR
jgi:hypothetical protein